MRNDRAIFRHFGIINRKYLSLDPASLLRNALKIHDKKKGRLLWDSRYWGTTYRAIHDGVPVYTNKEKTFRIEI